MNKNTISPEPPQQSIWLSFLIFVNMMGYKWYVIDLIYISHILFEVRTFLDCYVHCSFILVAHFFNVFFFSIFVFFQIVTKLPNGIYEIHIFTLKPMNEHLREIRISRNLFMNFKKDKNFTTKRLFLQLQETLQCRKPGDQDQHHQK